MFTVLPESNARPGGRPGVTVASVAMHAVLLLLGVWATAESGVSRGASAQKEVIPYVFHQPDPAPATPEPAGRSSTAKEAVLLVPDAPSMPLAGFVIPDVLPPVDQSLGDPFANTPIGVRRSVNGVGPRGSGLIPGGVIDNRIAEKPALPLESNAPPIYPDILRSAAIEGGVEIEFVIDPEGRARAGSIVVLRADHRLFLEAVREALISYRYLPAEVGGTPVAVRVRQSFSFKLNR